jgi:hypothetical protein
MRRDVLTNAVRQAAKRFTPALAEEFGNGVGGRDISGYDLGWSSYICGVLDAVSDRAAPRASPHREQEHSGGYRVAVATPLG